jgi:hypothetical protein
MHQQTKAAETEGKGGGYGVERTKERRDTKDLYFGQLNEINSISTECFTDLGNLNLAKVVRF